MSHHHCSTHEGHDHCCSASHEESHCHENEHACDHHHKDFPGQFLAMADEAWLDLLREKIKKIIEKTSGAHLDQLAEAIAKTNKMRWEHKMAKHAGQQEFHEKMRALFHKKS